jgi:SAM-dependent methyltransferase
VSSPADLARERWQRSGLGWRARADDVRVMGMPVSAWMVEQLRLQPGHEVLELAAGPGDTGFMAAELVRPGGRLICSDAVEAMLDIACERAAAQGLDNVEFKLLELDWIDLETASVDAVLCRWGIMFAADRGAAAREMRRVLRPGGRLALAAWDVPERNPWADIPARALVELGHAEPPDPEAPGMFVVAEPGRVEELLEDAGFTEVEVTSVDLTRERPSVENWLQETRDLSRPFEDATHELSAGQWKAVVQRVRELAQPYAAADGSLRLPAASLAASASA